MQTWDQPTADQLLADARQALTQARARHPAAAWNRVRVMLLNSVCDAHRRQDAAALKASCAWAGTVAAGLPAFGTRPGEIESDLEIPAELLPGGNSNERRRTGQ